MVTQCKKWKFETAMTFLIEASMTDVNQEAEILPG